MKRSLPGFLFLFILLVAFDAASQEIPVRKTEVKMGYGFLPASELTVAWMDMLFTSSPHTVYHDSVLSSTTSSYGAIAITIQRKIGKIVQVGGVVTLNPINSHYIYRKGATETDSWIVCTVMPRADIFYVNRGLLSLYSGLAVGVSYSFYHTNYSNWFDQSFNYFSIAYQLNALGIRVGKDIAGYVEFGFGYQGMVNLGISAKL
jgi:hypothetical protein